MKPQQQVVQTPRQATQAPKQATQASKATASMPQLGNMPSLGNLGMLSTAQPTTQPTKHEVEEQGTNTQRTNPFSEDQLLDAWVGLSKHFAKEERLQAMLSHCRPMLVNADLCKITVTNPWQKQEFAKFGKQVMDIIRDTLQNDLLRLHIEVAEHDHSQKPYTSADKYKLLTESNPHLAEMKTKLNLQLE